MLGVADPVVNAGFAAMSDNLAMLGGSYGSSFLY